MYGMASGGNMRMASMGGGYGNQSQWGYGVSEGADLFGSGPPQKRARENDDIGGRPPLSVLNEVYPNLDYKITETKAGTVPFFLANVQVDNKVYEGCGKSKKLAKNDAAQKVLEHLDKTGKLSNKSAIRAEALQKNPPKSKALSEMNIEELVNEIEVDPKLNSDVNAIKTLAKQCNMGPIMVLSKMKPNTVFQFASESGEPHDKTYSFTCTVDNKTFEGIACSKKLAKTAAARLALQKVCGVKLPDGPDKNNSQTMEIEGYDDSNSVQNQRQPAKRKKTQNRDFNSATERMYKKLAEMEGPTYELPPSSIQQNRKFANDAHLWIGRLPKGLTYDDIGNLFAEFGESTGIYYDEEKYYGFITMDYKENAERAKNALHNSKYRGSTIIVRFCSAGCSIKVKNLNNLVTNELLEYSFSIFGELEKALIVTDTKGFPIGEGIVEFCEKRSAYLAIRKCQEELFFVTATPRPVIVEPLTAIHGGDGYREANLKKTSPEYNRERLLGPRFAENGDFEEHFGYRWRQLYETFDEKMKAIEDEKTAEEEQIIEDLAFTQRYDSNNGGGYGNDMGGMAGGWNNGMGGGIGGSWSNNMGGMGSGWGNSMGETGGQWNSNGGAMGMQRAGMGNRWN